MVVTGPMSLEIETPVPTAQVVSRRRVPKSLIVLLSVGVLGFGALVLLIRMPKESHHKDFTSNAAPLTLQKDSKQLTTERKNSKGPLTDSTCKSTICLKTAYNVLDSMNISADPCTDFYEYACGGWVAKNPIPPQVSKWSHFGKLDKVTNSILQQILSEPSNNQEPKSLRQAKDFYKACSNVDELDRVGLTPIFQLLSEYGGWPLLAEPGKWNSSSFDWMKSMADLKRRFGTAALLDMVVNQHSSNINFNTIHLQQPSLFMSRPYLLGGQRNYPSYLKAYRDLIVDIAKELKSSPALITFKNSAGKPTETINVDYLREKADELIAFETQLANISRDGVTVQYGLRNSTATVTLHYLNSLFNNYTHRNATNKFEIWKIFEYTFRTAGVKVRDDQLISMADTTYVGAIFEILAVTPEETLANYLHFRMLGWIVSGTTTAMRSIITKYHRAVYGLSESSSRKYVCASSTEEKFGIALSRPYMLKTKLDDTAIKQAFEIMEQVRTTFISLLDSTRWMNETIKVYLRKKAQSISACIGYAPWMAIDNNNKVDIYNQKLQSHFQGLELGNTGGYVQKLWNVRTWLSDQKLKILNQKFTAGCKWTSFPGQIGAFYDIRRQAVNIPVGLLQPPFFYSGSPAAINYGGLGSILGHEFTHGFTVYGWTEDEKGSFSSVGKCFVDQYSKFKVPEAGMLNINGALTFDENFPDNGGLLEAFHTYKKFAPRVQETLPGLEQFTQDQLFFLGFANIWCSSSRREGLVDQVLQDHHTPNRYRVIGTLQNSEQFSAAWKCPSGSFMNPPKQRKCSAF